MPHPAPTDTSIEQLVESELGLAEGTLPRADKSWLVYPGRDLFGLALSGGGIRSATFNLGLLQGLHELGLLASFHYLSTVSGGGYIGAFWSAWRSRDPAARVAGSPALFPTPRPDGGESAEVRHLREFSNFLSPRLGLLSYDTGRMLVAAVNAVVPSGLATLALVTLVLFAWLGVARLLFPGVGVTTPSAAPVWSLAALLGVTALGLAAFEWVWRQRGEMASTRSYLRGIAVAIVVTIAAWVALLAWTTGFVGLYAGADLLPLAHARRVDERWLWLLAPSVAWSAGVLVLVLRRWAVSRRTTAARADRDGAFDRVASRLLFGAAASVIALLWEAALLTRPGVSLGRLAVTTSALSGIFALVQKFIARQPKRPTSPALAARLAPLIPQVVAYLTVALLVVAVMALILWAGARGWLVWLVAGAGAAGAFTLLFFDPNRMGLHAFYRGRIARAYLGASAPGAAPYNTTEERAGDDVPLSAVPAARGPVHLVCCAANDLAPVDPLANLYRGAVSAVLSPVAFSVGDAWTRWSDEHPAPSLASAVTASGAAFNSHMGAKSILFGPAVTFLMTALDLRLGLWLPHPTQAATKNIAERWLVGWPFFKEMMGWSRAEGRDVFLSDGGHFENMAVYELVRRHCRYIVAADCGQDGDVAFDDFGNLVRRVREDFGVEIRIDLAPLRPGPDGLARQPMVAGDIHYPDGDTGVLLLLKPTLVGNEPADVTQYKRRNAAFPHETTGDQFFDEAQWEAYRRLGQHAAHSAFGRIVAEPAADAGADFVAGVFARARRDWLAIPDGYAERVARFAHEVSALDAALYGGECGTLLREVYKEIDELDRELAARMTADASPPAPGAFPSPRVSPLDPKDLASSLHLIRRALLLMQEVYLSEQLDVQYNHPLYLGLMNYFARWAYAPLVRMWWPLLETLYPRRFTSFMEDRFGLPRPGAPGDGDGVVAEVTSDSAGFAMACWRLQSHDGVPPDGRFVSYHLGMRYRDERPYTIQAAQVLVRTLGPVAAWTVSDFFVPPGLWGVGIGERFLRRLVAGGAPFPETTHLLVHIPSTANASIAARKAVADETQLYRSCGFAELDVARHDGPARIVSDAARVDAAAAAALTAAMNAFATAPPHDARWLVRRCAPATTAPA